MSNFFRFRDKKILLGKKTYIMGILNVTPDSFSDGGKYNTPEKALNNALLMEKQGADFIDIGAQSTRPGHTPITEEEEWSRLESILPEIIKQVKVPVSVDTFYPFVAQRALELGCSIINDVSGIVSPEMAEVINRYNAGWILMHNTEEEDEDIVSAVKKRLSAMKNEAVSLNVAEECICLDAGIGFSKTMEQNRLLIKNTKDVRVQGTGYLLGLSRKRIIGEALNEETPFEERDFGTAAADTIGILGGADILRVHNCLGAVQAAKVSDYIIRGKTNG